MVSADLGVDVRRVAAVVRLKEVEKRWISEVREFPISFNPILNSLGFSFPIQ